MSIRTYLEEHILVFDGAMGTYLADCHPGQGKDCELSNLSHPQWIQEIHEKYLAAGAVAIKTNTFLANAPLQGEENYEKIIRAAWQIAARAAEQAEGERFVFADVGPVLLEEEGALFQEYKKIVDVFLDCGAENFLFETMETKEALGEIAGYIKSKAPEAFFAVSFAASPEGYTRSGFLAKHLFWDLQDVAEIDAVGFNCISGPKHLLELVSGLDSARIRKYLTVMPNAGYPALLGSRMYYGKNSGYFGSVLAKLAQCGAQMVGGCCGTSPDDIAETVSQINRTAEQPGTFSMEQQKDGTGQKSGTISVEQQKGRTGQKSGTISVEQPGDRMAEKSGFFSSAGQGSDVAYAREGWDNPKNRFAEKLFAGRKAVVVELDPPLDPDIAFFMEGAARYQHAGVDAIDIADCPIAKARIDSSILACKVTRELGLTAIPHMTCRDRNRNATKALLLGLNVEGVNNVLTVTGDPVPTAARDEIKTVFSYNSAVLARHIRSLNEEVFGENPFMVSGALNINALQFEPQLAHARKKIENGVSVLFTQPVLSERGLKNLQRAREELPVKILGGVMPVVSHRNALFMNHEMAGIEVAEEIIRRYEGKDREEGEALAFRISADIISRIAEYVDGFYLITPFKRVDLILRIVEYLKDRGYIEK